MQSIETMLNSAKHFPSIAALVALGVSLYTGYVLSSWLYLVVTIPTTNHRLVAAKKKGRTATLSDIPGPAGHPFVGPLLLLLPYIRMSRFDLFGCDMNEKYKGLFRFKGYRQMVFVDDAAMAKKILNSEIFSRGDDFAQILYDIAPTALFAMPTGNIWKKHRKALQPAFGPIHLKHAFTVSLDMVDQLLDVWEKSPSTRNVMEDFSMLTGDVIGKVAFSVDLDAVKSLAAGSHVGFFEKVDKLTEILQTRLAFFTRRFLWGTLKIDTKAASQPLNFIMERLTDIVEQRRIQNAAAAGGKTEDFDLLDRLLSSDFSDPEIFSEVFGFFLAGHETTANTLTWAMYELTKHPEVYAKLAAEVDSALGGNKPTLDSLNSLKYVDAVIKETLRYHSVAAAVARIANVDCSLTDSDGFTISFPQGIQFNVNIARIHLLEKYWGEDARIFKPERWEDGFVPIPGSYIPFVDGPHNCIGQKMALIEAKVALVRIVQRFKSVAISPKQGPIIPVTTVTHGLKHGLLVDVLAR